MFKNLRWYLSFKQKTFTFVLHFYLFPMQTYYQQKCVLHATNYILLQNASMTQRYWNMLNHANKCHIFSLFWLICYTNIRNTTFCLLVLVNIILLENRVFAVLKQKWKYAGLDGSCSVPGVIHKGTAILDGDK